MNFVGRFLSSLHLSCSCKGKALAFDMSPNGQQSRRYHSSSFHVATPNAIMILSLSKNTAAQQ